MQQSIIESKNNPIDFNQVIKVIISKEVQWKTKSLDAQQEQKYTIDLKDYHAQTHSKPEHKSLFSKFLGKSTKEPETKRQDIGRLAPTPKIKKISQQVFAIVVDREARFYYYSVEKKQKKTFEFVQYSAPQNIDFIEGNQQGYVLLSYKNTLVLLWLEHLDKLQINEIAIRQVQNLKIFCFGYIGVCYVLTNSQCQQFEVSKESLLLRNIYQIDNSQGNKDRMNQLIPYNFAMRDTHNLYFLGSKIQYKKQIEMSQLNRSTIQSKQSQLLTIIHFQLQNLQSTSIDANDLFKSLISLSRQEKQKNTRKSKSKAIIYNINYVFEIGLFKRSKMFILDDQTILIGLYEQIIVVRKQFNKFIIWDNVAIISSKSQDKKGQLILVNKKLAVFQQEQIFAFSILFSHEDMKIKMPPIDSFKGSGTQGQVLYDAVLLQIKKNVFMKILFYFKNNQITLPNSKTKYMQVGENKLNFALLCITQSNPKQKLLDLLTQKKPMAFINEFVQRFRITNLQRRKSQWQVCGKTIKDIQNILLDIKDDQYIQIELVKILKEKAHDLNFFNTVQKKQIQRFRKTIVISLLNINSDSNNQNTLTSDVTSARQTQIQNTDKYIFKLIQWLMESMMFQKKLSYCKHFLSFKQYDFIQIGKLKATSLKEQIKLLSSKKFQKRLKYFLNSFKFLALANYQQIFTFLLEEKSVQQIREFILSYRFILPDYEERSKIFKKRDKNSLLNKITKGLAELSNEERCIIWDDFNIQQFTHNIEDGRQSDLADKQKEYRICGTIDNVQLFQLQIFNKINEVAQKIQQVERPKIRQQAKQRFRRILNQFINSNWFVNSAFKQHAILSMSTQQLKAKFIELRREGALKLLIKILFRKIRQNKFKLKQVQQFLNELADQKVIHESFNRNIEVRVQIYQIIMKSINVKRVSKILSQINFDLPLLQNFLVMPQEEYFQVLLSQYRFLIFPQFKPIYDKIDPDFFRERFLQFLKSNKATLNMMIDFLDEFKESSTDKIRLGLFIAIKKHLSLSDYQNTKKFTEKSMDKYIFYDQRDQDILALKQQAKIPYGFYFYYFFKAFNINNTYQQLIKETQISSIQDTIIIKSIIQKYCDQQYQFLEQSCLIKFEGEITFDNIDEVQIHRRPLDFFGLILFMTDALDFKIHSVDIIVLMYQNYLNYSKFQMLNLFLKQIQEFDEIGPTLPHRDLLMEFKTNHDYLRMFAQGVIDWIQKKYKSIQYIQSISKQFQLIQKAIELTESYFNDNKIQKQAAFFKMLKLINNYDPQILINIEQLKLDLKKVGFNFMMDLVNRSQLDAFRVEEVQAIQSQIYNFYLIYSTFKEASVGQIISTQNDQILKFYIELTNILILKNCYRSAVRLLQRLAGTKLYSRDIILMFISYLNTSNVKQGELQQFVRDLLGIETGALVKRKLNEFIEEINGFYPEQYAIYTIQRILTTLLDLYKYDDAFYFLTRLHWLDLRDIQHLIHQTNHDKLQIWCYFLITSYIKCLKFHLYRQFYPSFSFFKDKYSLVCNQFQRMGMIKDFNIALSRLNDRMEGKDKIHDGQLIKFNQHESAMTLEDINQLRRSIDELEYFYKKYMEFIGQDYFIKLTDQDLKEGRIRMHKYENYIAPSELENRTQKVKQILSLQQNTNQINKVVQNNKINVFEKEIANSITQVKEASKKYQSYLEQHKHISPKKQYKELQNIKKKQMEQLQSVKDSFKSKTSSRVNELLINLKKKRQIGIAEASIVKKQDLNNQLDSNDKRRSIKPLNLNSIQKKLNTPSFINQKISDTGKKSQESNKAQNILNKSKRIQALKIIQQRRSLKVKQQGQKIRKQKQLQFQLKQSQFKQQLKQFQQIRKQRQNKIKQIIKSPKKQKQIKNLQKKIQSKVQPQNKQVKIVAEKYKNQQVYKKKKNVYFQKEQQQKIKQSTIKQYISNASMRRRVQPFQSKISNPSSGSQYSKFSGASRYNIQIHSPKNQLPQVHHLDFMPVTLDNQQGLQGSAISKVNLQQQTKYRGSIQEIKKQLESSKRQIMTSNLSRVQKKLSLNAYQPLQKSLSEKQQFKTFEKIFYQDEPEAAVYLQKLDMLRSNIKVGTQITKRIYTLCKNFEIFCKYLIFLIQYDAKGKEIIDQNAVTIAKTMVNMKTNIDLKILLPIQFFINVRHVSLKDFYNLGFEVIKDNIISILQKSQNQVHSLAILIRYSFGQSNSYHFIVYQQYGFVLMKQFAKYPLNQKKLFLLCEKLKNLYMNLNPIDRSVKFKKIIQTLTKIDQRNKLVQSLYKLVHNQKQVKSISLPSQQFIEVIDQMTRIYI